ncbi:hypothetical protein U1Q18_049739 [Sarracenia purpurea var. burkii]
MRRVVSPYAKAKPTNVCGIVNVQINDRRTVASAVRFSWRNFSCRREAKSVFHRPLLPFLRLVGGLNLCLPSPATFPSTTAFIREHYRYDELRKECDSCVYRSVHMINSIYAGSFARYVRTMRRSQTRMILRISE